MMIFPLGQISGMSEATIDSMMTGLQRLKEVRPYFGHVKRGLIM